MAKANKKEPVVEQVVEVTEEVCSDCVDCKPILPITEVYGNGDLNTLRDKINEIINKF
jgi:hypothetical protein